MKYYFDALKKYAVFSGRARRSEYWYFALFNFIFAMIALTLDSLIGSVFSTFSSDNPDVFLPFGFIYGVFVLVMQPLEGRKDSVGVFFIETDAVVLHRDITEWGA